MDSNGIWNEADCLRLDVRRHERSQSKDVRGPCWKRACDPELLSQKFGSTSLEGSSIGIMATSEGTFSIVPYKGNAIKYPSQVIGSFLLLPCGLHAFLGLVPEAASFALSDA